jgi:tetratricopeptide (TPR) repeat protein
MSFKAEIEALIANANSSLEDLEAVLRRAQSRSSQGDTPDASNGDVSEIQAQIDKIRQRILSSLLEIRESYNQDQARLSDLEGELKLDLENVRQCAIDYFTKGDYQGCERLLTFLAKIQPNDENLENFLELSRRKRLENELESPGAVADDQSLSKKGNREQRLADENQPVHGLPEAKVGRDEAEASFATEVPLPLGPEAGPDSPRPVLPDPQEPQETIEPMILAEIELKTAAHINEIYRTPPNSARPRFLVGAMALALGLVMTFYWLSRSQPDGSIAESLSASQSRGEEVVSPEDSLAGLRREAQELFDAGKLQEARRVSEAILAKDPEDSFALSLKNYARANLVEAKAPTEVVVPLERKAQLYETPAQPLEVRSDNVQFRSPSTASGAPLRPTLSTDRATLSTNQKPSDQRLPELELTKQAPPAAASVAPCNTCPCSDRVGAPNQG